ncbi:glycosyltransferase family 4 protein [Kribbella sp.]|uniref:glycosyltransferase family 4 protein n=1 Tax=Kribbella sp. TaxID=1871183 RepID=UPI002D3F36DD|nr:glycosyltransferase family 4 protein [Kribbella sp.]HZX02826.1 glycosyltransferase family 4 protein [Kribbella sp.]
MIAPPWFDIPPAGYGGIEAVVADLTNRLVAHGHDVLLIAAGNNGTDARFARTYAVPPSELLGQPAPEVVQAAAAARILADEERAGRAVDLVHDHCLAGPLLARGRQVPTVATMHGPVEGQLLEYFRELGDTVSLVAISDAQRRRAPELPWVGTVHNAIDVASFPYREEKEDMVVWLGRYNPDKAPHLAIDAARDAGLPIVCAGKCNEPPERAYFDEYVAPRLGPDASHIGMADFATKTELLGRARCLVFPIRWEEPFGLVMIEAMACGTPVVALRRGSVPEVVVDGVTGFVVDDPAELPEAIRDAKLLDPAACRRHVEEHFDLEVMASGYDRVYRSLVRPRPAMTYFDQAGSVWTGTTKPGPAGPSSSRQDVVA